MLRWTVTRASLLRTACQVSSRPQALHREAACSRALGTGMEAASLVGGRLDEALGDKVGDLCREPRSHAERHGVRNPELRHIALPQRVEVHLPVCQTFRYQ
jgi:hypothetical protein